MRRLLNITNMVAWFRGLQCRASSMMEMVVSMILISIVFGFGLLFIEGLFRKTQSSKQAAAEILATTEISKSFTRGDLAKRAVQSGELTIKKSIERTPHSNELSVLLIQVYLDEDLLSEKRKFVRP